MTSCEECGIESKVSYPYDGRKLCKSCYDMMNFFHIFFYDQKIKIFVDAFESKGSFYINILVFDFINKDFISRTVLSQSKNLHDAKYDAILFICGYISDIPSVTIYTDYKIMINHADETYKVRSPGLRKRYHKLEPFLRKGLKIEYIKTEFNMARMSPQLFRFFHVFEDYDRKVAFQCRKGEEINDNGDNLDIDEE